MRIIAGEFRSRTILPPATGATRPITDRAKQSLFDVLSPRIDGARVYDCFAGTGSMGLESLSRGAAHATFFEADRSALQRLRQNVAILKAEPSSAVISGDLFKWFASNRPAAKVDLLFLDPPYRFLDERPEALVKLAAQIHADHLADAGIVIFRRDAKDSLDLPPLALKGRREYGGMAIDFLGR